MSIKGLFNDLFQVDLTPGGFTVQFISGYIIKLKDEYVVVEQGPKCSAETLMNALRKLGYSESSRLHLFVTHIHLDHAGSVGTLLSTFKNSLAYVHPRAFQHLINPEKLWRSSLDALGWLAEMYGRPDPSPEEKLKVTADYELVKVRGEEFEFIYTEGHSSHHQSIFWRKRSALFVGDSAGVYISQTGYILPSTPYPTRVDKYLESLKKMLNFKPEYLLFPHYGLLSNGTDVLKDHLERFKTWVEVASSLSVKDRNLFIARLKEVDEKFEKAYDKLIEYPEIRLLLEHSIDGILMGIP